MWNVRGMIVKTSFYNLSMRGMVLLVIVGQAEEKQFF